MKERAKAGARALSDWLRRCRASVGEVRGETFRRLLEMLVLLYGVEVWGCGRQLGPVENVQMRAVGIFMGVGRLHPLASLQFEMNVLPVKWEAMKRGIEFWVHVMRLGEGRLLKEVMREAIKLGSRVKWVRDLRMGLDAFGWQGVDMQALSGLSMNEVKHILKCMAWRRAREGWREETRAHPKLEVMGRLMDCECKARCVEIDCKRQRRMLMKLRGGTAELRIETGRWCGLRRDERICTMCDSGEVEDVDHFLLHCTGLVEERMEMERLMKETVEGWQAMEGNRGGSRIIKCAHVLAVRLNIHLIGTKVIIYHIICQLSTPFTCHIQSLRPQCQFQKDDQ